MAQALEAVSFSGLAGFAADDCLAAFQTFLRSAKALADGVAAPRRALEPSPALAVIARDALSSAITEAAAARDFFERRFQPYRVGGDGFLTGYYEPRLKGSLTPSPEFRAPVLPRPGDLVTFAAGETPRSLDPGLTGAQRLADGALRAYPERAAIEAAAQSGESAILWLHDPVELFMAQVQGSALVDLPDGRSLRLAYDGRNGQPYTSIGRLLIESGAIAEADMSLERLKSWLRANGQAPGEKARDLMQRNHSYVFFKIETEFDPADGPVAGAGVPLTPLRSIAVDRSVWAYGTPFWLDAHLPWRSAEPSPFRRLTIAQDTGSAILGPARADLYFGGGEEAGRRAGAIRHACAFTALLPLGDAP